MSSSLADLMDTIPWLMTPAAFDAMRSIAERNPLPEEEIARAMHGPKALALRNGQRREGSGHLTKQGDVAIIYVDGPIYRYADYFTKVSGGVTTEGLARDYQIALDDPSIVGILSVFDSPGGEGAGINELADTIYAARSRKPIVAYVESQAASAAYWIASAHDEVVIDDSALVGSIGTVVSVPDPSKRLSRSIDFVSSTSPRKRPDPTTDEGRADIQAIADALNEVFIEKVARNMGVTPEIVMRDFGQGSQLVGRHAIAAGMAHRLGSEEGIIQELVQRATRRTLPPSDPSFPRISAPTRAQQEVPRMPGDSKGFWAGFWGGAKEAGIVPEVETAIGAQLVAEPLRLEAVQSKAADDEKAQAMAAENAELRRQLAQARAQQIQTEAQAFVKEQLGAGHMYPAEQQAALALYVRAAEIDATSSREDGQPSNVTLVKAAYADRPAASITRSLIPTPPKGTVVLANNAGDDEQAELERVDVSAREYAKRVNGKR